MYKSDQTDKTLVELTLLGDTKAYETLVRRHQAKVLARAKWFTKSNFMAEDAAQDAFVTAWLKLDCLKDRDKYSAWVCRIAENCAKEMRVRFREYLPLEYADYEPSSSAVSVEEEVISSMEKDLLHEQIDRLPEKIGQVIRLHYFEGLSIADIAVRMQTPLGTVKWQLHEGRTKMRKELSSMNERENDTLVEKVMKKVEELKLWGLKTKKDGFEEAYKDVLAAVESLPESEKKQSALADTLLCGWWWLPGAQNDELFARIKQAAIEGRNEDVMKSVVFREDEKVPWSERIAFMRDKQIPFLKEHGFTKTLGQEWFWLARIYYKEGQRDEGLAAFDKVLEILKPSDVYYANALSAKKLEELRCEGAFGKNEKKYMFEATAEEYRFLDGELRFWSMPGYNRGHLYGEMLHSQDIFYNAFRCDRRFMAKGVKVGETFTADNGDTLTFLPKRETVETPAGCFEDCQISVVKNDYARYITYFKEGIGIVKQVAEEYGQSETHWLTACHIEGGSGLLPCHKGNRWTYALCGTPETLRGEGEYVMTYADSERVILSVSYCKQRLRYDENNWLDMIKQMRSEYVALPEEDDKLSDVSFAMTRAKALAKTPYQKLHTEVACDVMERIMAGAEETTPNRKINGYWNFFTVHYPITISNGRLEYGERNHRLSFEWKKKIPAAGWAALYNDIYGILADHFGCLWSDEWLKTTEGCVCRDCYGQKLTTPFTIQRIGSVTTPAGTFDDCIELSFNGKYWTGGLRYRGGYKDYTFAPGVGIIRLVSRYKKDNPYLLTAYQGTGEGYMPVADGMMRRFEAQNMTEGHTAFAEYRFVKNDNGEMVVLENRAGYQNLEEKNASEPKAE